MRAKKIILELLNKDGLSIKRTDNLFSFIGNTYHIPLKEIKEDFADLIKNGRIFEVDKNKYITVPSKNYVRGTFIGNSKGFGFCQVQDIEMEDIFLPANSCQGVIDGDKIIVKILSQSEEGSDGTVVKVYKPVEIIAGVVVKEGKNYFIDPDNSHIPFMIKVAGGNVEFEQQDRVTARIERGVTLKAQIVEVLGKSDDVKALELAIIRDHQLIEEFSPSVLNEVKKLPQEVLDNQLKGRKDLTSEVIFTIDGLDAKDLDDAVSIKKDGDGYILGVHIADVGEYVRYNSVIDEEAFNRGTSVYFPTSVLPMLPRELSNGICSLNEGVKRLTLTCEMQVDKEGNVKSHKIYESVIQSKARLNYTDVNKVLLGEKSDEKTESVKDELLLMNELSHKITEKNKKAGCLDFEIPEVQFIFDENGMAVGFEKRERNDAHILIENFMVLANQTIAKEFCEKEIPFVYRVHDKPRKEKTQDVVDFLKGLNLKTPPIPQDITPEYYQNLIKLSEGEPYAETVNKVILRSMQKARYANECLGHFGLSLKYYCHFTSPIRRYPDLTIHRIIKECLHKGKLSGNRIEELEDFTNDASLQSSLTEKNADKAERDVDDLWKAYLMKDRIGENFEGIISSVTNFGFFVELDNTVEGLVRIENLPDSGMLLFEKQLKLKGNSMTFAVGDRIEVKLTASNVFTRKIDFDFVRFISRVK